MNSPEPATSKSAADGPNEQAPARPAAARRGRAASAALAWVVVVVHARALVRLDARTPTPARTIVQVTAEVAGTDPSDAPPRDGSGARRAATDRTRSRPTRRSRWTPRSRTSASTVRQVRGSFPQIGRACRRRSRRARSTWRRARDDYARRKSIAAGGAVSTEEVAHAREVGRRRRSRAARRARGPERRTGADRRHRRLRDHPLVMRAVTRVREAALALERTHDHRAGDGVVAKKGVQLGPAGERRARRCWRSCALDDAGSTPISRKSSCSACASGSRSNCTSDLYGGDVDLSRHGSRASRRAPAPLSRCCPRRTRPATGSRSCSACRCASRSTRGARRAPAARRPVDARRGRPARPVAARCWPSRPARSRRRCRPAATRPAGRGD